MTGEYMLCVHMQDQRQPNAAACCLAHLQTVHSHQRLVTCTLDTAPLCAAHSGLLHSIPLTASLASIDGSAAASNRDQLAQLVCAAGMVRRTEVADRALRGAGRAASLFADRPLYCCACPLVFLPAAGAPVPWPCQASLSAGSTTAWISAAAVGVPANRLAPCPSPAATSQGHACPCLPSPSLQLHQAPTARSLRSPPPPPPTFRPW
jgi:hypothetical protein